MHKLLAVLLICTILSLGCAPAAAIIATPTLDIPTTARTPALVVRYVKPTGESSGSCSTWTSSCTLQYALSIALPGQELWVVKGRYTPTAGSDRTLSFDLKDGVAIYGGFAGTETELTQRRPTVNVTILSGDLGAAGDAGDNSYHVVTANRLTSTAVLDGFTITGGHADANTPPDGYGGGMYLSKASPTLTTLTFSRNTAILGGGMFNDIDSNSVLMNVSFLDNTAEAYGGGMYNGRSNPTLKSVTFSGNRVTQPGGQGGGMFNSYSSPSLSNVTFEGNSAAEGGAGGGMLNSYSSPSLNNVTFSNNKADAGGNMYNFRSGGSIVNSVLWDGVVLNDESTTTITNSIMQWVCPSSYACTYVTDADPLLGPLQDNGGFVQTMALGPGSAAIDAGGKYGHCEPADARGVARPQGAACDLGAYEVGP